MHRLHDASLRLPVILRQHRLEGRDQVADHIFGRIVEQRGELQLRRGAGLLHGKQRLDQKRVLRDRENMPAPASGRSSGRCAQAHARYPRSRCRAERDRAGRACVPTTCAARREPRLRRGRARVSARGSREGFAREEAALGQAEPGEARRQGAPFGRGASHLPFALGPSAPRRRQGRAFGMAEAVDQMVVDHADRLHEGVDDGRPAEFETLLLQAPSKGGARSRFRQGPRCARARHSAPAGRRRSPRRIPRNPASPQARDRRGPRGWRPRSWRGCARCRRLP